MKIHEALERLIAAATADQAAVVRARDSWNRQAGQVHDDEPLYEQRVAAFLEWLAIDLPAETGTPEASPLGALLDRSAGIEREALLALATSHRSIFVVREVLGEALMLEDLWGGALLRVRERRRLVGIEPGDIFDGRIVADVEAPPNLVFARTFCPHPREVQAQIRQHVDTARSQGTGKSGLLFHLMRLRVRCERYRHVPARRVYGVDGGKLA